MVFWEELASFHLSPSESPRTLILISSRVTIQEDSEVETEEEEEEESEELKAERELMRSMNLPISFGSSCSLEERRPRRKERGRKRSNRFKEECLDEEEERRFSELWDSTGWDRIQEGWKDKLGVTQNEEDPSSSSLGSSSPPFTPAWNRHVEEVYHTLRQEFITTKTDSGQRQTVQEEETDSSALKKVVHVIHMLGYDTDKDTLEGFSRAKIDYKTRDAISKSLKLHIHTNKRNVSQRDDPHSTSSSEECASSKKPKKKETNISKYWNQRYRLFSKYDQGIRMDNESWFSVTPERIAEHIAQRCRSDVIVDAFCGVGGNAIQFAFTCNHVIAIDIDPNKISHARHNASVYNVADRIEFIVGDAFTILPLLKGVDAVFLSPPWGGPKYFKSKIFRLENIPLDGKKVFELASRVTKNIAYFLPRNTNIDELMELSAGSGGGKVDVEQNLLNGKMKTMTAYYGDLIHYEHS